MAIEFIKNVIEDKECGLKVKYTVELIEKTIEPYKGINVK